MKTLTAGNYLETRAKIVLLLFWVIAFMLYLPAVKAGWVIDAAGWLYVVRNDPFFDYINSSRSHVHSLYQVTQFITWVFYQLWGANAWCWSLLFLSLHALNAYLLFILFFKLGRKSGINNAFVVSFAAALLFLISPYNSEVVIWKACYHYLQGLLFILLILHSLLQYQQNQSVKYPILAASLFFISTFTLEVFYLTPVLVFLFAVFFRFGLRESRLNWHSNLKYFLLPQLTLFIIYFVIFKTVYHGFQPHIPDFFSQPFQEYASKPAKYLFHLVLLGRFFTPHDKIIAYQCLASKTALILFYGSVFAIFIAVAIALKRNRTTCAFSILILVCVACTISLLMPLPFPNEALLVFYDRYCYFTCFFVYLAFVLLIQHLLPQKQLYIVIALFSIVNLYWTVQLNGYWKESAYCSNRLLREYPRTSGDTVTLLLDLPENMNGVPMIGADPESEFRALYRLFVDTALHEKIFDVRAFNLLSGDDGAYVKVIDDSTIQVSLNKWGSWWWFEGHGASSNENAYYSANSGPDGLSYQLHLKGERAKYRLLFQTASCWKVVDRKKLNVEQH